MKSGQKRIINTALLLLAASPAVAQTKPTGASNFDVTLFVLTSLALIFALAAGLLAIVLKQLVSAFMDKKEEERKAGLAAKSAILLLPALLTAAVGRAEDGAGAAAAASSSYLPTEYYVLYGVLAFELLIIFVLIFQIRSFARLLQGIPQKAHVPAKIFRRNFLDIFNKSVSVDKESDILLDHDYDGIKELDNDLPPWWKWGFVLTIVVSFVYLGYYHAAGGPSQADEFRTAMADAAAEKEAYLATHAEKIDENNLTLVVDAAELDNAKMLFANTCAACHRGDGGGNVGPNLTDQYWLHGGSLQDVFKTIKYGWRDKGMPPWDGNLSAKQMAAIASYVKTLNGTHPSGGKAPQGELYVEQAGNSTDSSGAAIPAVSHTGSVGSDRPSPIPEPRDIENE